MVEYTVILAFGVVLLMGPGGDVLVDLAEVFYHKYRGYSYAVSLSPMPEFDTGPQLREFIEGLNLEVPVDDAYVDRLTVDPVQEQVTAALEPFTSAFQAFNDIGDLLGDLENLDDLAAQMAADAISPF
ncbi:MAG: hypothetical protein ACU85V_05265 [Gammaproteobacteria bacterium]